ncbi:tRNA lysidine(34) synthetase TilS [Lactococcus termiticola]|uniref:tRNA(Ile)-lysidine synthase n=1 Tax=Lactococcus termiticola TaxID=2169526 RepID=A0A2R5HFT3_9LACT|nr:tRNA lysidine(34) synthetase TilS [Lactococcus termiticola]GBG96874.1 tRNA(Ile)-lysidine synthetase [Lactococcus termiticola]
MKARVRFLSQIKKEKYFERGSRVLLALSGGLDSMTLFHWLYEARDELGIELGLVHVNHGQRPASDHEESALRAVAEQLSLPFYSRKFTGNFSEASGRAFRYAFFEEVMREYDYDKLLTAHHANDQVETFLMRIITGRRLRYLAGIEERQAFGPGELIRPLLRFKKSDFLEEKLDHFEDESNQESDYFRNRVRNQLIPDLERENPRLLEGILSLSEEIKLAMTVIHEDVQRLGLVSDQVDLKAYASQSQAMKHFILQEYLSKFPELEVKRETFDDLFHILERPEQYDHELADGFRLVKTADSFSIEKGQRKWLLEVSDSERPDYRAVNLPLAGKIEVRKRQPADEILVNGHHKKVRKVLIEKKIPLAKRELSLLLVDGEVYAIGDMVISDLSKGLKNDKMKRKLWLRAYIKEEN